MNLEDLRIWQDSVMEHCQMMKSVIDDRMVIKNVMVNHLKQFFEFDEIRFSNDFNEITLKWRYDNDPILDPIKLKDLGMDFKVSNDYSESLGHGVVIIVYPFGYTVEEDDN